MQAALDETVGTLKRRAQTALGFGIGKLLDKSGCVVDGCAPMSTAGVQNGDALTLLHTSRLQVQGAGGAFAALFSDGSVATWGHADLGGNSIAVQEQLMAVQQIQASALSLAAIMDDGSVVTWGHADFGGDSSAVQAQLKHVQQIQATESAFAAILADGSVVTWGDAERGGDSRAVQDQLKNVLQIQATYTGAFAAIRGD